MASNIRKAKEGGHSAPWLWLLAIVWGWCAARADVVVDDFAYLSTGAARQAWPVSGGAPAVSMGDTGFWGQERVMILPCDFATRATRCYWDRSVNLNLSHETDFALEIFVADPGAFAGFTLYFRSGSGWYGCSAALAKAGWQTLRFSALEAIAEGTPTGWHQINGVRLSPWKGATRNTELAVRQLRAFTPTVLLVRDALSGNPAIVTETIDRHRAYLDRYGITSGVVSQAGVEAGLLAGCRFAVLPYNETISEAMWTRLEEFVVSGGKLIAYYLVPARLEPLLGIHATGWRQGDFAAWSFLPGAVAGLPAVVNQASWNITTVVTNGAWHGRVVAGWNNSQGQATGFPAWVASDHGYYLSHVLLGDDADQKAYTLLCLLGQWMPELWPSAATSIVNGIGVFAGFASYEEARRGIGVAGWTTLRSRQVTANLDMAARAHAAARADLERGEYVPATEQARLAQGYLEQAYQISRPSRFPEFRAFWDHDATGPYPGRWDLTADLLATNGFNAVFPNMLWGGLAHYASDVLPRSSVFQTYGDQIAACVTAAHARGVQVHVWKVNWNLSGAPQSFIDNLRSANRTQVTSTGKAVDWLCPSHPDNLALETNSLLEVVRNYDVDGIHFDYIRYPDSGCCYCTGCAARFQAATGLAVSSWPAAVLASGSLRTAFLNWRRAQITRLVAAVSGQARQIKPQVRISAAVFPDAPSAYDDVGQDWRSWIDAGIVDFLCPMDYTTDRYRFAEFVAQQRGYANGRIPIYPGIGAHQLGNQDVVDQIEITRTAQTGGFIVFELGAGSATSLLPALVAGTTAPDPLDADQDTLPDGWETRWFGVLDRAGVGSDSDGDGLADWAEYVLGSDPTQRNTGLNLTISQAGNAVEVSLTTVPVLGAGYEGLRRIYGMEEGRALATGTTWSRIPGLADQVAGDQPERYTFRWDSAAGENALYRVRVWLERTP